MSEVPGERYVRESRIATGGMGEVWRARDTVLGREVAVKLLKPEYTGDADFRARFEAEARHAAALHHPGIASVFDYGVLDDDRTPFLVMELVDGEPLSDLLAGGRPIDPEQARLLVAQAADALGAAHAAGVVHRDVKPANLLVTPDGRVKITDFGIARAVDSVPITATGQIMGTPQYISPEQARGERATSASDVYALGVVLFECLAGRRPFTGDSPVATALAHLREDIPALPDSVPADLVAVVHKAMAKDPAARYDDGGAFAAALRSGTEQRIVPPVPPPADATQVLTTAAPPVAVARTTTETAPPPDRTTSGSRWAWLLAGLLVLLVVVLLLATRPWENDSGDGPTSPGPSSPTASKSRQQSPSATPTESASASQTSQVTVDPDDYVGKPVDQARSQLRALGLQTSTQQVDNPGDKDEDTVAGLSPTGQVDEGSTITLQVYGPPPDSGPVQTPSADPGKPSKPAKPDKSKGPAGGRGSGTTDGAGPAPSDTVTPSAGPGKGNGAGNGPGNGRGTGGTTGEGG